MTLIPVKDALKVVYHALVDHYVQTGNYPHDLGELVKSGALKNAGQLVVHGTKVTTTKAGTKTSFEYTGAKVGRITKGWDRIVWLYLHGTIHGKRWVLFADGTVEAVPEAKFRKLLAETLERVKK
jgi:hypothetical protein